MYAASAPPTSVTSARSTISACSPSRGNASGASCRSTMAIAATPSGTGIHASSNGSEIGGATSVSRGTRRWNGIEPSRTATTRATATASSPIAAPASVGVDDGDGPPCADGP